MTDRELLELAAKNLGFDYVTIHDGECVAWCGREPISWNPMKNDGDAFRLSCDCFIDIELANDYVIASGPRGYATEEFNGDRYAATRRAITRAAAEIGKRGA